MKNVCIIGGGSSGMKTYIELKKIGYNCTIFEDNSFLGGQITKLYPNKTIYDIVEYKEITGLDYVNSLIKDIDKHDVHLSERVIDIVDSNNGFIVNTNFNSYFFNKIVLCTGLGFSKPRELGLEGEKEADNILYSLDSFEKFTNKDVCIFGGGDSALDWARELDSFAKSVSLIHRRDEFRGNVETIKNCKRTTLYLSCVPYRLEVVNKHVIKLEIQKIKDSSIITLKPDYILVCFGNIPFISKFMFNNPEQGFIVENHCRTSIKGIFAIGDNNIYENKKKRIQPAIDEIKELCNILKTSN